MKTHVEPTLVGKKYDHWSVELRYRMPREVTGTARIDDVLGRDPIQLQDLGRLFDYYHVQQGYITANNTVTVLHTVLICPCLWG